MPPPGKSPRHRVHITISPITVHVTVHIISYHGAYFSCRHLHRASAHAMRCHAMPCHGKPCASSSTDTAYSRALHGALRPVPFHVLCSIEEGNINAACFRSEELGG